MIQWKSCRVKSDATLWEVLGVIDSSGMKMVVVVDEDDHLLGIMTDGDVRRAILQGISMETKAEKMVNSSPVVFHVGQERRQMISNMKNMGITHAPLLDDNLRVVDILSLHELLEKRKRENIVVLMAGGLGTRLRPLTDHCPKPLLKVGNKPILETILEGFIDSGFENFYFAINYHAEMIEDYFGDGKNWNVHISYLREKHRMGTGGALYLLPQIPESPAIVMNSDILTKMDFGDFLEFHNLENSTATMAVREYSFQIPYGVIDFNGNSICSIREKPMYKYYVNAGMYVLSPDAIAHVKAEMFLDMTDLFHTLIDEKKKTTAYRVRDYWLDIGQLNDFRQAQYDYDVFWK